MLQSRRQLRLTLKSKMKHRIYWKRCVSAMHVEWLMKMCEIFTVHHGHTEVGDVEMRAVHRLESN